MHYEQVYCTTMASPVRGKMPHEKSEGRTPSGWSKELEDDVSAQRLFSENENMLLRLTMGLQRDCIGPERALNMLQK